MRHSRQQLDCLHAGFHSELAPGNCVTLLLSMNELRVLNESLERQDDEVFVDEEIAARAMVPLRRMLDFEQ